MHNFQNPLVPETACGIQSNESSEHEGKNGVFFLNTIHDSLKTQKKSQDSFRHQ